MRGSTTEVSFGELELEGEGDGVDGVDGVDGELLREWSKDEEETGKEEGDAEGDEGEEKLNPDER